MIIVDTNVVSELMKSKDQRDARVVTWLDGQTLSAVYTTVTTVAEIMAGLAIMPDGRRRTELLRSAQTIFDTAINGRILPFDHAAALVFSDIQAERRAAGRPIADMDALILSIARVHGATLATRNIRDFADSGVDLVDPWTDAS